MTTAQVQTMTTQEVANRFYELAQQGNWTQIQEELFSEDARSVEPEGTPGLSSVKGLQQIREKGKAWEENVVETHSGYCQIPQVAGRYFCCTMGAEVTMKGQGRIQMDEVALYEVKDGKIVLEQFFY
jgi:hypothetical protein